jgi:hypothetical protein
MPATVYSCSQQTMTPSEAQQAFCYNKENEVNISVNLIGINELFSRFGLLPVYVQK